MSIITEQPSQEDLFQSVIDPSFLSSTNDAGTTYNMFSGVGFEAIGSQTDNPFFLPSAFDGIGASTGLTPGGRDMFFDSSFPMQTQQGDNNSDLSSFFTTSCSPPLPNNSGASMMNIDDLPISPLQQVQDQTTTMAQAPASNARKQGSSLKKEAASKSSGDGPPVKRRRNRKKKPPTESEAKLKRERFLERNRIAASKCRTKKKQSTSVLEEKLREFQAERKRLENDVRLIMTELDLYKEELEKHAHCGNRAIEIWLTARAEAIANNLASPSLAKAASYDSALDSTSTLPAVQAMEGPIHNQQEDFSVTKRESIDLRYASAISPGTSAASPEQMQEFLTSPRSTYSFQEFECRENKNRQSSVDSEISTTMRYNPAHRDSGVSGVGSPQRIFDKSTDFSNLSESALLSEPEQVQMLPDQRLFAQSDYHSLQPICLPGSSESDDQVLLNLVRV